MAMIYFTLYNGLTLNSAYSFILILLCLKHIRPALRKGLCAYIFCMRHSSRVNLMSHSLAITMFQISSPTGFPQQLYLPLHPPKFSPAPIVIHQSPFLLYFSSKHLSSYLTCLSCLLPPSLPLFSGRKQGFCYLRVPSTLSDTYQVLNKNLCNE